MRHWRMGNARWQAKGAQDRNVSRDKTGQWRDALCFRKNYDECCVMLRAIAVGRVNLRLNLNCYAL